MRVNEYTISDFICPECGRSFPLPRQKSKRREKGHIKDLYCPFCKKYVKTFEERDIDFYASINGKRYY